MACETCAGGRCKGGGNLRCARREPADQHIAIILDTWGGSRTVVGTPESIQCNVRHDELVYVVPNLIVHEPIAWGDIPIVIERARLELVKWLDTRPNLTEIGYECVKMYRIRSLRHNQSRRSLDFSEITLT